MSLVNFKDLPDTSTPLRAQKLNGLLNGDEAMGQIVVEDVICKNLFNINQNRASASATSTVNEDILTVKSGGTYCRTSYFLTNLTVGETYTVSFSYNNPNGNSIRVGIYSGSTTVATSGDFTTTSGNKSFTFTSVANNQIRFYSNTTSTSNTNSVEFFNIQIEKGGSATNYVKYKKYENSDDYSINEQVIGTWIDGKPIYRYVYNSTTKASNYVLPVTNAETIVKTYGTIHRKDYPRIYQPIPSRLNNSGAFFDWNTVSTDPNGNIQCGVLYGSNMDENAFNDITIIVEYTKTTD